MKTDNEIIAEFMGLPLTKREPSFSGGVKKMKTVPFLKWSYHQSWNELMPVVEKIQTDELFFSVRLGYFGMVNLGMQSHVAFCVIENSNGKQVSERSGTPTLIDAVYGAVVDFVKWYNENKKP